jgi:hypothetical protein
LVNQKKPKIPLTPFDKGGKALQMVGGGNNKREVCEFKEKMFNAN